MAGGNRVIHDTSRDVTGVRLKAHKDYKSKSGETHVEYSSGHTLKWEKTEVGDGKRLKEVRTLTRIYNPVVSNYVTWNDPEQYDRIFKKGRFAQEETHGS